MVAVLPDYLGLRLDEYKSHDSLQGHLIQEIGHWIQ